MRGAESAMAILQRDFAEAAHALQGDGELRRVFRALARLSGGPLLEIAKIAGVPPNTAKAKLDRLEELSLAARTSTGGYDSLSVYYHLTSSAYQLLSERKDLV
jgi:DNA-binding MarR family transcriptional regulator